MSFQRVIISLLLKSNASKGMIAASLDIMKCHLVLTSPWPMSPLASTYPVISTIRVASKRIAPPPFPPLHYNTYSRTRRNRHLKGTETSVVCAELSAVVK